MSPDALRRMRALRAIGVKVESIVIACQNKITAYPRKKRDNQVFVEGEAPTGCLETKPNWTAPSSAKTPQIS
jgi:hypothetical protein